MFHHGPSEGYMSAKADALKLDSSLKCRRHNAYSIQGYVVWKEDVPFASAATSREAWNKALEKLIERRWGQGLTPVQRQELLAAL